MPLMSPLYDVICKLRVGDSYVLRHLLPVYQHPLVVHWGAAHAARGGVSGMWANKTVVLADDGVPGGVWCGNPQGFPVLGGT